MTGDTTKIFNAIDTVEEPEVKALRERLIERVRNAVKGDTPVDQIPGLHLSYVEQAQTVSNCFYVLSVGLILQGTKNLVIGDKSYRYGTGSMIVTSVDMPTSYELVGVKPSNPFVSLSLRLNPATIADFLLEEDPPQDGVRDVFNVEKPTQELLEDFERLLKLLDHPEQIKGQSPDPDSRHSLPRAFEQLGRLPARVVCSEHRWPAHPKVHSMAASQLQGIRFC